MITDAFFGVLAGLLSSMLGWLPEWSPDLEGVATSASDIGGMAGWANGYFPIGALALALVIVWGYRLVLMVWRMIIRVWELLPLT